MLTDLDKSLLPSDSIPFAVGKKKNLLKNFYCFYFKIIYDRYNNSVFNFKTCNEVMKMEQALLVKLRILTVHLLFLNLNESSWIFVAKVFHIQRRHQPIVQFPGCTGDTEHKA